MKFRKPTSADLPLLSLWNHHLIRDERHRNRMAPSQLKRRMAGWLKKRQYSGLIFEVGPAPVGYVLYRKEKDHIYLRQFFIDRKYRRKGLGQEAMKHLLRKIWPKDFQIRLDVLVDNRRARAFWHSLGFRDYCLGMEKR
jgi:ribosomal protein S18 acetylase RimI-like enzyme